MNHHDIAQFWQGVPAFLGAWIGKALYQAPSPDAHRLAGWVTLLSGVWLLLQIGTWAHARIAPRVRAYRIKRKGRRQ